MNPWKENLLILMRDIIRFSLWICVAIIGLMTAIFSIWFVYNTLVHLAKWCDRVLFPGSW